MSNTILNSPIWETLSGPDAAFAIGDARARRYHPRVNMIGAPADTSAESLAAFGALVAEHGTLVNGQTTPYDPPPGTRFASRDMYAQMVLDDLAPARTSKHEVVSLGANDSPEMLALARLTKPGPFADETYKLGEYLGIRINGQLVAMAGERFKAGPFTEVSGVCTHPDAQGQGLAYTICHALAQRILARGRQPFLHVASETDGAGRLYQRLGFRTRTHIYVTVLEPA